MRKGGTLSYLLANHLGSTTAVLDTAGNVVSSRAYWPYGAERALSGDARATDQWYTGQRDEDNDGLGLYHYKARMYSTVTGRFVSARRMPEVAGIVDRAGRASRLRRRLFDCPYMASFGGGGRSPQATLRPGAVATHGRL